MQNSFPCPSVTRRACLQAAALGGVAASFGRLAAAPPRLPLGFSLYGMRSLPLERAIAVCREIGYECVELPVMKDWPADSAAFSAADRAGLERALADHRMRLSAVMENLPIFGDQSSHESNLRRVAAAGQLARDVSGQDRPIMETILGGKPAQWPGVRSLMAKRLEDWARAAEKEQVVVAIKAHVGGAMHLPEHPASLVEQLDNPWIRAAYDFSHFRLREVDMEQSVKRLAPLSVFAHVKDAAGDPSRVRFLLPGEGDIDYTKLLRLLRDNGYRGDICVEVSGQIHGKPGYDPIAAARKSYTPLANAVGG